MKIGYLGPKGTYCYEACNEYVQDKNIEKIEYITITEALISVQKQKIEFAIVPIENSIYGSVLETIDFLIESCELKINAEIILNINHYLLAPNNCKIQTIKEIYSHTQALAQCRKYLKKNFPDCIFHEIQSTAAGAKIVKDRKNAACIANKSCAEIYGLNKLDKDIQDENHNQTRFVVVGREIKQENQNKISMIFSTSHKPGELYRALAIFDILKINLTKIESRPARTKLGEYVFWVDFEGKITDENVKQLIKLMENMCSYTQILGCY